MRSRTRSLALILLLALTLGATVTHPASAAPPLTTFNSPDTAMSPDPTHGLVFIKKPTTTFYSLTMIPGFVFFRTLTMGSTWDRIGFDCLTATAKMNVTSLSANSLVYVVDHIGLVPIHTRVYAPDRTTPLSVPGAFSYTWDEPGKTLDVVTFGTQVVTVNWSPSTNPTIGFDYGGIYSSMMLLAGVVVLIVAGAALMALLRGGDVSAAFMGVTVILFLAVSAGVFFYIVSVLERTL